MLEDLRALVVFAQVVETKSFSKAADRLEMTKSAVSKHVAQLEAHLGAQLLVRTTRKLSLTEVGERVYQAAAPIAEHMEQAREAALSHSARVEGRLRVTAPSALGREYVVPLVTAFLAKHPALEVDLVLGDVYVDLVQERIDVALRVGRFVDSSLVARRIMPIDALVCASPSYLARRGTPKHPRDLCDHDWLVHAPNGQPSRITFRKGKRAVTVRVKGRFASNDGMAGVEAAALGMGIVLAPEFELSHDIRAGRLVPFLSGWKAEDMALYTVFPPRKHVSSKVRAFVDFVVERWRTPPWQL